MLAGTMFPENIDFHRVIMLLDLTYASDGSRNRSMGIVEEDFDPM